MSTEKLSKRQKKAIAFRDRTQHKDVDDKKSSRKGKGKGKLQDHQLDVPESDVPDLEDQALPAAAPSEQGMETRTRAMVNADPVNAGEGMVGTRTRKRKREAREASEAHERTEKPEAKRRKASTGGSIVDVVDEEDEDKAKRRLILFLGNLKYTTTVEHIRAHFSKCDPPPAVRLLTPKVSAAKPVTKSKGCAFLEFKDRQGVQQALKLHHSQLDGRKINVELTAGGGGKGETRLKKLKERNKELEGQRRKKQHKRLSSKATPSAQETEGAQRFSATSGAVQEHTKKRTWSVGDVEEIKKHRGGKKQISINKRKPKVLGTGVNAIPMG